MKLLLFSDLHEDQRAARELVRRAPRFDVLVGAGDFGNVRRGVDRCIGWLRSIERPVVLVPGNNESTSELGSACLDWPAARVLHGDGVEIDGVPFFGIGGGVPVTPFGAWSHDFTEEQAAALLRDCPAGGVLVCHSPPQGVVDQDSRGRHLGSVAIRDVILRVRPRLVVCGHIHGSAGRHEILGETPVVNAGPGGVEWELADV